MPLTRQTDARTPYAQLELLPNPPRPDVQFRDTAGGEDSCEGEGPVIGKRPMHPTQVPAEAGTARSYGSKHSAADRPTDVSPGRVVQ